ncbi:MULTISPECIES: glycosyltransferase [unclassified Nocardioides]|uniref:glycosyltransferase n=1 Tax=unclassified Nocardioides TaxID=2615069 RepID=UPI0030146A23
MSETVPSSPPSRASVVVAAHDEEQVIERTLGALLAGADPGELEVVVVANGCTDRTADRARRVAGVTVLESERPSKTEALRRGDRVATAFPRIYLDADIPTSVTAVRRLCAALDGTGAPLVAVPSRRVDVTGRPWPVRAYTAVHLRLPVVENGLFGRGMIALSEAGRGRFTDFPDVVADDLFLDSLFTDAERVRLPDVATTVEAPLRTGDLVRRLVRVRRGNAELRRRPTTPGAVVRRSERSAWLRDVVLPRPWLAPAATVYVALTGWAALQARRVPPAGAAAWGRDASTRTGLAR